MRRVEWEQTGRPGEGICALGGSTSGLPSMRSMGSFSGIIIPSDLKLDLKSSVSRRTALLERTQSLFMLGVADVGGIGEGCKGVSMRARDLIHESSGGRSAKH